MNPPCIPVLIQLDLVATESASMCVDDDSSRFAAFQEARIQAHFADVVAVEYPAKEAFQSESIAAVRTGAESPLNN